MRWCIEPAKWRLKLSASVLGMGLALALQSLGMPPPAHNPSPRVLLSAPGPIQLGAGPVEIFLHPAAQGASGSSLSARIAALAPGERVYLVLRGLSAQAQPGVVYHIYIYIGVPGAAPANATSQPQGRLAGTLNFFNVVPLKGATMDRASQSTRSIDVTQVLKDLQSSRGLGDQLRVTVWPSGSPVPAAKPAIGQLDLVVSPGS